VDKLEGEGEVEDIIVVTELKEYYNILNSVSSDWYIKAEDKMKDSLCLDAITIVLSHYMTREEHKQWLESTVEKTQK
jgi:hypothetical protein